MRCFTDLRVRSSAIVALCSAAMLAGCRETTAPRVEAPSTKTTAAPRITLTDLGTLPGGTASLAIAINSAGEVVGKSNTATGDDHAFLWVRGVMTDLGTLGGTFSVANAINDAGQVVGFSSTASGLTHAFLWQHGTMRDLGVLPGTDQSSASGINAGGQIAGAVTAPASSNLGSAAVVWDRGAITPLPVPVGGSNCQAVGIDAAGQAVGTCGVGGADRAELWGRTGVTDLGSLGGNTINPTAINASGQVVGISSLQNDNGVHPFLWDHGTMTDLTTRGVSQGFIPNAINAAGQIVGDYGANNQIHAALLQHGTTVDLGVPPGTDAYAFGINAAGQVVGHTVTASGQSHAVMWTVR
jgi:probable HAF family extracellular repeat protein